MLFAHFPEARAMLVEWSKENIQLLNCESARAYVLNEIVPVCLIRCNDEFEKQGMPALTTEEFMSFVGLSTVSPSTAWRWLRLLGFRYENINKCFYTDKHEDAKNIADRIAFIERYFRLEMRAYRWVQLKESEAIRLENLTSKTPLEKKTFRRRYPNKADNDEWYREYHVDVNPLLPHYVTKDNRKKHGGDLSFEFPVG